MEVKPRFLQGHQMLESILERPSLEESQAGSALNGTAGLSLSNCQEASNGFDASSDAAVVPSSDDRIFASGMRASAFGEVRVPPRQIAGARQHSTLPSCGPYRWLLCQEYGWIVLHKSVVSLIGIVMDQSSCI